MPLTMSGVLADVARVERYMRTLRRQAYDRVIDGRSDESDLRRAYEILRPEMIRRLEIAAEQVPDDLDEITDTYQPTDPFEAFAIVIRVSQSRPDGPVPKGTLWYIRKHLDSESMRRTKRTERAWCTWRDTWMLLFRLQEIESQ